ncbi:hypothetical protein L593_06740 [Salinarchaeum sp. Harcht-Bsk1]|uniref:DUF5783 family protein n=1 Tax=Salinarchaeum sp. Harcht-Bsk1 TaxID=1333523 RepID=UPI0003423BEC|nr:DUF5783 family protein [Salinarchaeum sp. Harcht-Bsk1]AGN01295.1 hypothetical protein L593_06740 [Salinarchaeum sp. Harcht-Bsk1]
MSDLDPETFDERKYVEDFPKLQRAYKNAFETMNDAYNSELVHAIDQQVLAESEPFYEGDGEFRIELPEDPYDRLEGTLVDEETFQDTLERYVEELKDEIARTFSV